MTDFVRESSNMPPARTRMATVLVAAISLSFVVLQIVDIETYPVVTTDEAFLNDPGLQLVRTGRFRSDILRQNPGFEGCYFWQPPGLALSAALSYKLFGFGIWQTRLPGVIFGAAGIVAMFLLVMYVSNSTSAALFSAMTLSVWPYWVRTSKEARMDTAAVFFLMIATLLAFTAIEGTVGKTRSRMFLAGVAASAAAIYHPASFSWFIALVIVTIAFSADRVWHVLLLALGASTLIGSWLAFGFENAREFKAQFVTQVAGKTNPEGLVGAFASDAGRYAHELRILPFLLPVLVLALAGLWKNRSFEGRRTRLLALLWAAIALANVALTGKDGAGYYTLYGYVPLIALTAIGFAGLWQAAPRSSKVRAACNVAGVLFLLNCAAVTYGPRVLALWGASEQRSYYDQFKPLSELLRPGDEVWGTARAWYAVVKACARMDTRPEPVPIPWESHPFPEKHRYVVVLAAKESAKFPGFKRLGVFGSEVPRLAGRQRSYEASYRYELWESTIIAGKPRGPTSPDPTCVP